jgi:hypothetical protein
MRHDTMRILMTSEKFLGLWVESRSELLSLIMSNYFYYACIMMIPVMDFMYKSY